MTHRTVINARIVIESSSESPERTNGYVVSALKNACKNIRDGTAMIVIYDESDHVIGADLSGTPSDELADAFDDILDKYADSVDTTRPVPKPPSPPTR